MRICTAVFFIKKDGSLVNTYQYGMINQLQQSKDYIIRKAIVKYCNYNENVDRFVTDAVNELVLIHPMIELRFMEELGNLAHT